MIEALDPTILGPAMLAGLLVLSTHVPLGREVLARGIIFIDLAVAQIAGLGLIAAAALGWDPHSAAAQVSAVAAAMAGGLGLTWTEKKFGQVQEAVIGAAFVLAASAGILMLAQHPRGGEELQALLVGQILWADWHNILPAAVVSLLVTGAWFSARERIGRIGFYLLFALAVTVSVQLVGVFLVFASLILPSLATRNFPERSGLWRAFLFGALGYALGLVASAMLDLPTGAVIVWAIALVSLVANRIGNAGATLRTNPS